MNSNKKQSNFKSQGYSFWLILLFFNFSPFQCFADSNQELCERELLYARASSDLTTCLERIKNATEYFDRSKHTVLEKADFNYSIATIITKDIKEFRLTNEEKNSIAKAAVPYFEESKNKYKEFLDANKKAFEEFMENVSENEEYRNSKELKILIKNLYGPFVIAFMRYFECVVEKANLTPIGDTSRCGGLFKKIDEAEDFGYLVEAPVTVAIICVHVGRIFSIMSECGVNAKENREKAFDKFKEVLVTEKPSNYVDADNIRLIKVKAINGMIELALITSDYHAALKAIELYLDPKDSIMPITYSFSLEDFGFMLNAILINAHAFKKLTTDKEQSIFIQNIKNIQMHLEKAIPISKNPDIWKKKLDSYIAESNNIMGSEVKPK